jgi:hypothetical protein
MSFLALEEHHLEPQASLQRDILPKGGGFLLRGRQEGVAMLVGLRVGAEFCLEAFEETHALHGEMCLDVPPRSASQSRRRKRSSIALILATFGADRPPANSECSQTSTSSLASSGPTTCAPMVIIWASLLLRARSAW